MDSYTRDGRRWTPEFLVAIDSATCLGCGRCFKVCGRRVMTLRGISEDGELVDLDEEFERKVMVLDDAGACIGCGACARVCPTGCQKHESIRLVA
ncbi:MAG: ferredoxin III, nif-specific [Polyangiaceae bacterium]